MGSIDDALKANELYARNARLADRPKRPARKLAVLACIDARMNVEQMLGLAPGDAHVIRNAGAIATEDALRSLLISHYLLGTNEFMIVSHTDCGVLGLNDRELRKRIERETGASSVSPAQFHGFSELDENVRRQVRTLRAHPWIPASISIRGFIYDVSTGRLAEVDANRTAIAKE